MKNKPKNNQPKHIIVAEDELSLSSSLQFILTAAGYTVSMVPNGREALIKIQNSLLERTTIDLLITDIAMPTMTGVELIRALRNQSVQIPVLVITGYGDKELLVELMRLGCQDFLDKPFSQDDLERRVHMILTKTEEQDLEQKRKESLAMIGERSRSFIHDLNNILCGALGYADTALEKVDKSHPAHEKLVKLVKTANRAADICRSLMAIKPDEPFRMKIKTEIWTLVEKMAAVLTELAPQSISISTQSLKHPVWLIADSDRVQQALLNLGFNAFAAMKMGGALTISLTQEHAVRPGINEQAEQCVVLHVQDTGCGLPHGEMERIFEEGYTTRKNGFGLGLSLVKKIVQHEHNGWITVESEMGEGTLFKLFFPMEIDTSKK